MIIPVKRNFTIYQGASFREAFQWLQGGAPVDLTGAQIRAQIRQNVGAAVPLVDFGVTAGTAIEVVPLEGRFALTAAFDATEKMAWAGAAVWDLEVTMAAGTWRARLIEGQARVSPEVTR